MTGPDDIKGQYHSYLVRLWHDDINKERVESPRWQGEVINIQSGQSWRVQNLEPLVVLLKKLTSQEEV
ncbi:MAG: hypothetical protein PVG14_07380 [Anaerolineales bacterium]|jgi:hypothetical protein